MPVLINSESDSAALALAQTIIEFGKRNSNPVVEIIADEEKFLANKKYPRDRLRFGDDHWRAYYHTHDAGDPNSTNRDSTEHGHFHIFFRIGDTGDIKNDWTHVTGLSMDWDGQPIKWFTVNNWVTGDTWIEAQQLIAKLDFSFCEQSLVARWLGSILACYQQTIAELLLSRDQLMGSHTCDKSLKEVSMEDVLMDREIYSLSSHQIDLLQDLKIILHQ